MVCATHTNQIGSTEDRGTTSMVVTGQTDSTGQTESSGEGGRRMGMSKYNVQPQLTLSGGAVGRVFLCALALHCDMLCGGLSCRLTHLVRRRLRLWLRGYCQL